VAYGQDGPRVRLRSGLGLGLLYVFDVYGMTNSKGKG
jgi:hypothetical protein